MSEAASEDHLAHVRNSIVTIDAVCERIGDDVDEAILRDAQRILDEYQEVQTEG